MSAPEGNQFWKARSTHGRSPIFDSPETLWGACCEYFEWVDNNPLLEEKLIPYKGDVTRENVAKMRAMTISGMCLFLDICENTWANYKKIDDFLSVTKKAENIIYNQKFTGASADLLNANIIARDLCLRDKVDHQLTGPGGGPIITSEMTPDEAAKAYAQDVLSDDG